MCSELLSGNWFELLLSKRERDLGLLISTMEYDHKILTGKLFLICPSSCEYTLGNKKRITHQHKIPKTNKNKHKKGINRIELMTRIKHHRNVKIDINTIPGLQQCGALAYGFRCEMKIFYTHDQMVVHEIFFIK